MTVRITMPALALIVSVLGCEPSDTAGIPQGSQVKPGKQGVPADASPAVKRLIEKTSSSVAEERASAAEELRELGDEAHPAIVALIRLLDDESKAGNRHTSPGREARATLKEIGKPAVPSLLAALPEATLETKRIIVALLGESGDPRVTDTLVTLLGDNDPLVRYKAVWAVNHMEIRTPKAVRSLIRLLQDDRASVVRAACEALGEAKDRSAVGPLLATLNDTKQDESARSSAANALGQIADHRAFDSLLEVATNTEYESGLRGSAARGLGLIKDPRALPVLQAMLEESDRELRQWAVWALGPISQPSARDTLLAIMNNDSEESALRRAAIRSLICYESPRVIDALIAVFENERDHVWVWRPALDWLALSSNPRAYSRAIDALADPDAEVRREAARVFLEAKTSQDAGVLGVNAEDMARILPAHKDPRIRDALIAVINRPGEDEYTRWLAAKALVKTGDPRAKKLLQQLEGVKCSPKSAPVYYESHWGHHWCYGPATFAGTTVALRLARRGGDSSK
ncbi:MAG: HEAT repeat domain-containing protein [Candidatus Nealsonbacteria bacterium]|nr:HEAT repeat domain-containing protein [Candidatus Nealsonbacteria bacterium]